MAGQARVARPRPLTPSVRLSIMNQMWEKRWWRTWFTIMVSFSMSGSTGDKSAGTVPDLNLLKRRVDSFYESIASQDWAKLLEVLSPETRGCSTASDLEKETGLKLRTGDHLKSWKIRSTKPIAAPQAELEVQCNSRHYTILTAAEVTMSVKSTSGGNTRAVEHKDEWVYVVTCPP
jgi:hypothetical protein